MSEQKTAKGINWQKWITLIIVAAAGGLITKLPYLRETYMVPLQAATGATKTQLGLIMSAYGIVNFICYFPGGVLADRFSAKKLIAVSCFGTGLLGLWYWTMPGFTGLVIIHALFAITTVFTFWAAMVKSINNLGGPEEQGKLFGFLEGGRGLIGTLAAFGSVAVFALAPDDVGGMKNAIMFYSIALIICGVLVMLVMKDNKPVKVEKKEEDKITVQAVLQVVKIPRVWLCGVLAVCNYSALIFHGYITAYLSEAYGISSTVVANLSVIRTYFLMMVGSFAAGLLADKLGSRIRFMQYAYIGMAVFASLYVLIPVGPQALPLIVANFIAYGLCLYSIKALYFSTIDEVMIPKRLAGTASGIISLLAYAPEMFLYTVSAQMVDKYVGTSTPLAGYVHCFIWMAVLSAIGFVSAIVLRRLNNKAIAAAKAAAAE